MSLWTALQNPMIFRPALFLFVWQVRSGWVATMGDPVMRGCEKRRGKGRGKGGRGRGFSLFTALDGAQWLVRVLLLMVLFTPRPSSPSMLGC
jgi:hypothetical protein